MQTETPRFKEWLCAEKDAQAAERELHAVIVRFASSSLTPPLADKVLSAREKRARAQRLLDEAMQELKDIAEALRRHPTAAAGTTRTDTTKARYQGRRDSKAPSQQAQHGD